MDFYIYCSNINRREVNKMYNCPCGRETEEVKDYFEQEVYDIYGNAIGFICIHGQFINYSEED